MLVLSSRICVAALIAVAPLTAVAQTEAPAAETVTSAGKPMAPKQPAAPKKAVAQTKLGEQSPPLPPKRNVAQTTGDAPGQPDQEAKPAERAKRAPHKKSVALKTPDAERKPDEQAEAAAPDMSVEQKPVAATKPSRKHRAKVARNAADDGTELEGETSVAKSAPTPALVATGDVKELVSFYAQRYGVPETLAHRIVIRESRYNPGLTGRGHYGLMQISLPTARQMGYAGAPQGLLDARTNLQHGMPYLANAWIVSGGSEARAVSLYARGYYYDAKRKGLLRSLHTARKSPAVAAEAETIAVAQ